MRGTEIEISSVFFVDPPQIGIKNLAEDLYQVTKLPLGSDFEVSIYGK